MKIYKNCRIGQMLVNKFNFTIKQKINKIKFINDKYNLNTIHQYSLYTKYTYKSSYLFWDAPHKELK